MSSSNNEKSYFLKDEAIKTFDDDKFRYEDIAKNLRNVIETNNPPFNIAIIGKWGLGKSSLINMVVEPYKKTGNEEYLVQEINAWKYEKESLCKVFLKQLWQSVKGGEKVKTFDIIKREVSNILDMKVETNNIDWKKLFERIRPTAIAIGLVSSIALFIYKVIQGAVYGFPENLLIFLGQFILSYCKNISTVLFIPVISAILIMLFQLILDKENKKIEMNFPLETNDDYEIMLEAQIAEKLHKNPNLKVITIIDDLDRLSLPKIVEALDALKTFINLDRCIFIVPFDDSILKKALAQARLDKLSSDNVLVESELVLDKLFQYKIYMPPLLDFNIKKYAVELCIPNMKNFVNEYCDKESFEKILRNVLIHNDVKTPRQVKKLANIFASNLMIALDREGEKVLSTGFASTLQGKYMIAFITVLQADYNEFYDLLFKDSDYINIFLNYYNKKKSDELPQDLKMFFDFECDTNGLV